MSAKPLNRELRALVILLLLLMGVLFLWRACSSSTPASVPLQPVPEKKPAIHHVDSTRADASTRKGASRKKNRRAIRKTPPEPMVPSSPLERPVKSRVHIKKDIKKDTTCTNN